MKFCLEHSTLILLTISFFSCKRNIDVDEFIRTNQSNRFLEFKNAFITYRGSENSCVAVYVLSKTDENLPTYRVYFNHKKNKIERIDRSNLIEANVKDYFTEQEINTLMTNFNKYDFYILGVDSDENVYINPYIANAPAYFLKLSRKSNLKEIIAKGYIYKHYKDSWYINIEFKNQSIK